MRGLDRLLEQIAIVGIAVHGQYLAAFRELRLERRTVPQNLRDMPFGLRIVDRHTDRIEQVDAFAMTLGGLLKLVGRVGVDQRIPPAPYAVERRARDEHVHPIMQKRRPIIRLHAVQRFDDIGQRIRQGARAAVLYTEKGAGEIVERTLVLRALADQGIDVEPEQRALAVVILETLPVVPGHGPARVDDGVVRRILKGTPASAGLVVVGRGGERKLVEHLLPRPERRARGEHLPPVLGLPFVHPEQAVLHGNIVVGDPEVGRAAEFAVPGVRELVGQQIAAVGHLVPVAERFRIAAVFAGLRMLQTVVADLVAQRKQKIVMGIVMRAEQLVRLLHQRTMGRQLFGLDREQRRPVGEQIEVDGHGTAWVEFQPRGISAGVHRTVDQCLQAHRCELGARAAAHRVLVERRGQLEAGGQRHARMHRNLADEVTGWVQHEFVPFQQQQIAAHFDGADGWAGRGQVVEIDVDRLHPRAAVLHPQGVHIDRIAFPGDRCTLGGDVDAGDPVDGSLWRMLARQPPGVEQHAVRLQTQSLVHVNDTVFEVGGVDLDQNLPRIGPVARGYYG